MDTYWCVLNVGIVDGLLGVAGMIIVSQWIIPENSLRRWRFTVALMEVMDETQPALLLTWQLLTPKLAQIAYHKLPII